MCLVSADDSHLSHSLISGSLSAACDQTPGLTAVLTGCPPTAGTAKGTGILHPGANHQHVAVIVLNCVAGKHWDGQELLFFEKKVTKCL